MDSDLFDSLKALGIPLPSPAYLVASVIFSFIGYIVYKRGKKDTLPRLKWTGVVLMVYPGLIDDLGLMVTCGVALSALAYHFRK